MTETNTRHQGCVKWFNKKKGYGFIEDLSDKSELFVHHTAINSVIDCYNLLFTGEYVEFNVGNGKNGPQCEDVTGICRGKLMCDVNEEMKSKRSSKPTPTET